LILDNKSSKKTLKKFKWKTHSACQCQSTTMTRVWTWLPSNRSKILVKVLVNKYFIRNLSKTQSISKTQSFKWEKNLYKKCANLRNTTKSSSRSHMKSWKKKETRMGWYKSRETSWMKFQTKEERPLQNLTKMKGLTGM
jgi:hypothetical protein